MTIYKLARNRAPHAAVFTNFSRLRLTMQTCLRAIYVNRQNRTIGANDLSWTQTYALFFIFFFFFYFDVRVPVLNCRCAQTRVNWRRPSVLHNARISYMLIICGADASGPRVACVSPKCHAKFRLRSRDAFKFSHFKSNQHEYTHTHTLTHFLTPYSASARVCVC